MNCSPSGAVGKASVGTLRFGSCCMKTIDHEEREESTNIRLHALWTSRNFSLLIYLLHLWVWHNVLVLFLCYSNILPWIYLKTLQLAPTALISAFFSCPVLSKNFPPCSYGPFLCLFSCPSASYHINGISQICANSLSPQPFEMVAYLMWSLFVLYASRDWSRYFSIHQDLGLECLRTVKSHKTDLSWWSQFQDTRRQLTSYVQDTPLYCLLSLWLNWWRQT